MRRLLVLAALAAAPALPGCGGTGSPPLNTAPLTEEEKRQIKEADDRIDEEEKSGSGTAVGGKKWKKK